MPDTYTGRDGLTHQFTNIDWDEKTKISSYVPRTPEQRETDRQQLMACRNARLEDILAINPAMAGEEYEGFVIRDYEKRELRWDEPMVRGHLILKETEDDSFLYRMFIILSKRAEAFKNNELSLKTPQVKG